MGQGCCETERSCLRAPRLTNLGGGGSTTGSCSATSVAVTFDEVVTTTYGQTVKM